MLERLRNLNLRRVANTRLRILGWYILLMGAAMVFGLLLQRTILLDQVNDDINAELRQEVEELNQLVDGRNPETGEPFGDDVAAIFSTFLRRNVPVPGEGVFTLVNGEPYRSSVAPLQLMEYPDIVQRWAAATSPYQSEIDTEAGRVRYLAVPVYNSAQEVAGVFVVVSFLDERIADVTRAVTVGALVFGTTFIAATVLAWFATGRALRPVGLLTRTARTISDSNWTERIPVEGDDEIAELAVTFNEMLDRLESAFSLQRRFIDDAGHELRTPITIIRGHLELLGTSDPGSDETRRLVLDELDRMSRLVDDLLLLARAEQPDFLDIHPIDIAELMEEIAVKAAPLSDRQISIEEQANVVIDGDRQRLTQAVMNLVRNALVHTPPDTHVSLGSRYSDGRVELWVADDGDGIPLEDQQRIFDRFSRGSSGKRRTDGSGLGLSIVAIIADAHGGDVQLSSLPGQGARFTIRLPAEPAAYEDQEIEQEELWV